MTGARVPFALVGVLLLVGSATFVGSLQSPTATEPTVDDALDRTAAETQSAVRDGVSTAARKAARDPITVPADTPAGSVVNDSTAFRDALRIRVYLAVRERLARLAGEHDGLNVTASLPSTETPAALGRAKRRVTVERAGSEGRAVRATITNLTLTARRNGRVVGKRTLSPTVTVPIPTLFVHQRVRTFERRLSAGPGSPGLGTRLVGPLYALTWARGYAQFGGAPIANVVTNRHIALLTNGAILRMQRQFFGHSDKRGRSLLRWATANTALTDAVDGGDSATADMLSTAHDDLNGERVPAVLAQARQSNPAAASPTADVTIGINESADRAFLEVTRRLSRHVQRPYRVAVRRQTAVRERIRVVEDRPDRPGATWTLEEVAVSNRTTVTKRPEPSQSVATPWHVLSTHARWVNQTTTVTRIWQTPNGTERTVERRRTAHAVTITLAGRHDRGDAPMQPFDSLHAPGGPLDGPNLADVDKKARRTLVDERGGVAAIAKRTVTSGSGTVSTTVLSDRPDSLRAWVYRDLVSLRERVSNVSVTVSKGKLATLQANPADKLRDALEARRDALLDVPPRYEGVASRARIATRQAYFESVLDRLQRRAKLHDQRRGKLDRKLTAMQVGSLDGIQSDYENRQPTSSAPKRDTRRIRVDASPSYLTLGAVSGDAISGIPAGTSEHPLVARNQNVFTLPYGDVADAVTGQAVDSAETRLRTAAQVLASTTAVDGETNTTAELRAAVVEANDFLKRQAADTLLTVRAYPTETRVAVVQAALSKWDEPAARAQALSNGSAAVAIQTQARQRWNLSYRESDRLGLLLEQNLAAARTNGSGRPSQSLVAAHAATLKRVATSRLAGKVGDVTKRGAKEALERTTRKSLNRLPSGLPVAPVPPAWYLTINYWDVEVAGEYARFVVSVPVGSADDPGGRFTYVRDGSSVTVDVDGDGVAETLGRGTRITFHTHASVAIAVPPKPRGVGDVDGQMVEASPGWPSPGDGRLVEGA